jgi:hypothetical protein
MRRGIPVVLKAVGAFLIGGVVLAGCGAGAVPQNFTTPVTSLSVTTTAVTTMPVSTAPAYSTTSSQPPTSSSSAAPAPTQVAAPAPATTIRISTSTTAAAPAPTSCSGDYYRNVDGNCVHRPVAAPGAPAGATARCNDGTYSFSTHRQGTCSGHGGVSAWL